MGIIPANSELNPFPGLRPFLREERKVFFGRENESAEVLNKLLQSRFVTVIGSSGSGKSSLINCGVVPKLTGQNLTESSGWQILAICPGIDPFGNLADALSECFSAGGTKIDKATILTELQSNPAGITGFVRQHSARVEDKILLVVDQFEELFINNTLHKADPAAAPVAWFVDFLVDTVDQSSGDIYVIIAMSSDYVGECAHYQGLTQVINKSNYLLPQIGNDNYRIIIEGPVKQANAQIDEAVVEAILKDIDSHTDQLPVLQHIMTRTWDHWKELNETDRPVGISDYNSVGTMKHAMSLHADEAFNELDSDSRKICEVLFKTLAVRSADKKHLRHPADIETLKAIAGCSAGKLIEVIEKFRHPSRSFLSPQYPVELNEKTVINISSDSLIKSWDRLKSWIEEEISSVGIYLRLSESSALYQKGKTTLLKNADLQLAISWRENQKPTLKWAERYDTAFERTMVYLRTSEKAYLEEEIIKKRKQQDRTRKNRFILLFLGLATIIFLGLMVIIYFQKRVSDRQRSEATAKALFAEKSVVLAGDIIAVSDSNAAAAARREKEAEENAELARKQQYNALKKADMALSDVKRAEKKAIIFENEKNMAVRRKMVSVGKSLSLKSLQMESQTDLQTIMAYQAYLFNKSNGGSSNDADIYAGLYNVARKYGDINCRILSDNGSEIKCISFIPGTREFFTSGNDGKVIRWDIDRKNSSLQVIYSGAEIINVLAVSPDAEWLAMGGESNDINMVAIKGNSISYELKGNTAPVKTMIFSYDGRYLYSSSLDGKVLKWDLTTRTSTNVSVGMKQITSIDLSADNRYIAGVSTDGKAMVWNPELISDNFSIESPGKTIRTVRFKPDENKIAIGYTDGYIEMWDLETRKKVSEINTHNSGVNEIRFNLKFSQLAASGNDGTVRLWDLSDPEALPVSFNDNGGFVVAIDFSSDGQVLVSGSTEGKNNLIVHPASADVLARDMCSVIPRNFTKEEWVSYVGRDIEYEKTCPGAEHKIKIDIIK